MEAGVGETPDPDPEVVPWVVSARSEEALRAQARVLGERVRNDNNDSGGSGADGGGVSAVQVGWSLVTTRSVFEHRAVVTGRDLEELLAGLDAVAGGQPHPEVITTGQTTGTADGAAGVVLVFSGQGSQWAGMGAGLLQTAPVFAARIGECEQALAPYVDWSLTQVLRGHTEPGLAERVDVVQPALWAMMVALAAEWAHRGIIPAAVVGHSQGEIAAACVAGALTLDQGARITALRSQALRELSGQGAMAALATSPDYAQQLITTTGTTGHVVIAAINSPTSVAISGPPQHVHTVITTAHQHGLRAKPINVDYASHSPQIDQITPTLTHTLTGIHPNTTPTHTAFYSTLTATRTDPADLDTTYWIDNLRHPVRLADTITQLLHHGHRIFIETTPHPVLTPALYKTIEHTPTHTPAITIPTLHRNHHPHHDLTHAAAKAFTTGLPINWTTWYPTNPPPHPIDLPTYPFQRHHYWPQMGACPTVQARV